MSDPNTSARATGGLPRPGTTRAAFRGKLLSLGEIISLALIGLPLVVTVSLIEDASWVRGLPSLKALVLVPMIMWAYMARSSMRGRVAHPLAFVIGLLAAFLLGAFALSASGGMGDLGSQIGGWFGAIGSEQGNRGVGMMGVFLMAITLWVGYASVWLAYRRTHALLAALPGLGVLLVVLTFLNPDYYWYFFLYLLAAAPGIISRRRGGWTGNGRRLPLAGALVSGILLMAVSLAPAWMGPSPEGTIIPMGPRLEGAWLSFQEGWSNLFQSVPDRKGWPAFTPPGNLSYLGPALPSDPNYLLFTVASEEPHRWRMQIYETYTGAGPNAGWEARTAPEPPAPTDQASAPQETSLPRQVEGFQARREVEVSIRMYSKSRDMVFPGEPIGTDELSYKIDVSPQPTFKLYLEGPQLSYLPPDIEARRDEVISQVSLPDVEEGGPQSSQEGQGSQAQPQAPPQPTPSILDDMGLQVSGIISDERTTDASTEPESPYLEIQRLPSGDDPPVAVRGQRTLVPPKRYTTVGSISIASSRMLRVAGEEYPGWVTDRYLQLPGGFPDSVRGLAWDITQDEETAYDKVEAVRRYLLKLPYSLEVPPPPEGQDWVEYFLLVQGRGYSQNYASAMVTMLRSLGIPARLVAGFAPGAWNEERSAWEVSPRHYHTWPEVYFPGYGWVEFEPTPVDVQPALHELGFDIEGVRLPAVEGIEECLEGEFDIVDCANAVGTDIETIQDFLDMEGQDSGGLGESGSRFGIFSSPWTLLGIALALALVVAPVGTFSYIRWSTRRLGYPAMAYASMGFLGRLAGARLRPNDTPWEYRDRLSRMFPGHSESINHIAQGYVATQYTPSKGLTGPEVEQVKASWSKVRSALLRRILLNIIPRRLR